MLIGRFVTFEESQASCLTISTVYAKLSSPASGHFLSRIQTLECMYKYMQF